MRYLVFLLVACRLPAPVADKVCPVAVIEPSSQPASTPVSSEEGHEPAVDADVQARMDAMSGNLRDKRIALATREKALEEREAAVSKAEAALKEAPKVEPAKTAKKKVVEPSLPLHEVVGTMSVKSAARMLEAMGIEPATRVLQEMPVEKASELLTAMPASQAARIASLMQKKKKNE